MTRLLVAGTGLVGVIAGVLVVLNALDLLPFGIRARDSELVALWNESRYEDVLRSSEEILAERPLDGEALTFGGFAAFYTGIELVQRSEQLEYLDRAIVMLRKARQAPRSPLAAERDYVLAKAYYHRGTDYMDLSVRYMERSLEAGLESPDSRTYLGLAYANLEDYEESARWFSMAMDGVAPNAALGGEELNAVRIKAAESYVALERYPEAERLLREAMSSLEDEYLELMARNELASVLMLDGRLGDAEALLDETIERFPESADAYYYLGVVYHETDRMVEARGLWRTARDIDPNHTEALQRLAGTSG